MTTKFKMSIILKSLPQKKKESYDVLALWVNKEKAYWTLGVENSAKYNL